MLQISADDGALRGAQTEAHRYAPKVKNAPNETRQMQWPLKLPSCGKVKADYRTLNTCSGSP